MLFLTGCQAADPGVGSVPSPTTAQAETPSPTTAISTAPAVPEPTPASSDGPAANLSVPVKPPLADENTKEGLEAFTRYWFELFNYGYATNDWTAFSAVTDAGCGTCNNVVSAVRDLYAGEGWVVGATTEVGVFTTDFQKNTEGSISSYAEVVQSETATYNSDGSIKGVTARSEAQQDVLIAVYEGDRWIMLDFGSPEGT